MIYCLWSQIILNRYSENYIVFEMGSSGPSENPGPRKLTSRGAGELSAPYRPDPGCCFPLCLKADGAFYSQTQQRDCLFPWISRLGVDLNPVLNPGGGGFTPGFQYRGVFYWVSLGGVSKGLFCTGV